MRNVRKQSNTLIIPLTALAAIVWGALFAMNSRFGRATTLPGLHTTLAWLPYWAWSGLFIGAGVMLLTFLRDWAVIFLMMVLCLYTCTLATNIFVTETASLTGPIWPALTACNVFIAAYRVGVRKPPP